MVEALPDEERDLFQRIFHVSVSTGSLIAPDSMYDWIRQRFGSVRDTEHQKVVKITNMVTFEGTLFNELRARRPIEVKLNIDLDKEIEQNVGDPLCRIEEGTPEDAFGRVRGQHCVSASNIAKYDAFSGLVIFKEHNPLHFTPEKVVDYIDTGIAWIQKAHQTEPMARYGFMMWNCLWNAGASLLHGHMQVTATSHFHYAKIEMLRRAAISYLERYGSNYFEDLFRVYQALGCGFEKGRVKILASLTPIKEKETKIMASDLSRPFKERIYDTLACFRDQMAVRCFNMVLYLPPFTGVEEDWRGFPIIARVVDRGDPQNRTTDIGSMELYAASVVASDPFKVAAALKSAMEPKVDQHRHPHMNDV